jgi:3-deoxy-alpha-D-manno-octulosonate 8-oxidase
MVQVALFLEPLWENALGSNWRQKITPQKIKDLYLKL